MTTNDNSNLSRQDNAARDTTDSAHYEYSSKRASSSNNGGSSRLRMRKTPQMRRISYPYIYSTGETVTVYPSREGVTDVDIKNLYACEDAEVHNNLKHAHPYFSPAQKAQMTQWRREHPGEMEPDSWHRWNVSLDTAFADESCAFDKSQIAYRAWISTQEPELSPRAERIFDFVATLTPRQQKLFDLAFVKELPQTDIAAILDIKPPAVSRAVKRLREAIKQNCR